MFFNAVQQQLDNKIHYKSHAHEAITPVTTIETATATNEVDVVAVAIRPVFQQINKTTPRYSRSNRFLVLFGFVYLFLKEKQLDLTWRSSFKFFKS